MPRRKNETIKEKGDFSLNKANNKRNGNILSQVNLAMQSCNNFR
jgi:hypothetical protein